MINQLLKSIRQYLNILNKFQKSKILFLLLLVFFGMLLEVFGIGILIPFITLIVNPQILFDFFNNNNIDTAILLEEYFKYLSLIVIIVFFIIRNLYLIYIYYYINKLQASITYLITKKIYSKLLFLDYSEYLKRETSDMIKNLQVDSNFFGTYFIAVFKLLSDFLLMSAIFITLFIIEPIGTLLIFILTIILSISFLKFTKSKIYNWGKARNKLDKKITKTFIQNIQSIREIILNNSQDFFINQADEKFQKRVDVNKNIQTLNNIPKYYLEVISVIGFSALVFFFFINNYSNDEIITLLGVFLGASIRVLPSSSSIIQSIQSINYFQNSVKEIFNILSVTQKKDKSENLIFTNDIIFKNVNFKYPNSTNLIFKNLNLKINRNNCVGIIGKSGSGKSTFIDLLSGLLKPSSGEIYIDSLYVDLGEKWRSLLGYVSQNTIIFDQSIEENIAIGSDKNEIDYKKMESALKESDLYSFYMSNKNDKSFTLGAMGKKLSGGQAQRIGIARALFKNPDILILDEPTSALDEETSTKIMNTIYSLKKKKTIIIISHDKKNLNNCDIIYSIEDLNLRRV